MTRVVTLVNLLRIQGVEVSRADSAVELGDETYPAGSFVIKRDQPYGRLAKILLETQDFPDDSLRTYDDTGWTMGLMHHAEVVAIDDERVLDLPIEPINEARLIGRVEGGAASFGFAVAHYGSNHLTALRYRLGDLPVEAADAPFEIEGLDFPAGSFVIPVAGNAAVSERIRSAIAELGLTAAALAARPDVDTHPVDLPRLAMYSTWGNTQEVGWVRHAFDQFEIPFDLIFKERVRQGDLRSAYDVIVVPNQGRTGKGLVFDIAPGEGPRAYTKTERFKFLGDYGSSEDITGGMGIEGVLALQRFVEGRRPAGHARRGQLLSAGVRSDAGDRRAPSRFRLLRARTARRGRDSEAGASDLLRVRGDRRGGALRQRTALAGAPPLSRRLGADEVPGERDERTHARRRSNGGPSGDCRRPAR